jgi:glycerol-3-phosphate dehydrogenase subunit C
MKRIPGLEIVLSHSECCGVAGTYGVKKEKYAVARDVGKNLFQQTEESGVDIVVTDSETCRWWLNEHTSKRSVHPIQILAHSIGLATPMVE